VIRIKELSRICVLYDDVQSDGQHEVQKEGTSCIPDSIVQIVQVILEITRKKEKDVLSLYKVAPSGNKVVFSSGLLDYVEDYLISEEIEHEVERLSKLPIRKVSSGLFEDAPEPITLRDYQRISIRKGLSSRRGIFNIATGGGKTEIIIGIAHEMEKQYPGKYVSLTIVPSKASVKQIYKRFKKRGLSNVGRVGGGFKEYGKMHTVATAATLYSGIKNEELQTQELLSTVKVLMLDECHHLGTAPSWQSVVGGCDSEFRFGFSGSPWACGFPTVDLSEYDVTKFADFRLASEVGETLVYIPSRMLRDMGVIIDPHIYILPVVSPNLYQNPFPRWKWVYSNGIVQNPVRNTLITNVTHRLYKRGHRPVTLVVSISHGKDLLKQMHDKGLNVAFTKGNDEVFTYNGKRVKSHKDAGEKYREAFQAGEVDALIGSVVIDESIDLPEMSALILAGGMKSPIRAVQRIGRAIRTSEGKGEAVVIDFRDKTHFFLENHTNKRLAIYDAHDYEYQEVGHEELSRLLGGDVDVN
jgi:superfamily II DNA or RNA helicase